MIGKKFEKEHEIIEEKILMMEDALRMAGILIKEEKLIKDNENIQEQ